MMDRFEELKKAGGEKGHLDNSSDYDSDQNMHGQKSDSSSSSSDDSNSDESNKLTAK